jgi:hypothetical protein
MKMIKIRTSPTSANPMGRIGSGGYTALRWEGGDLWWECVHEGGEAAVLNLDAPTRPACPWQRMLVGKRVGLHIADDAECALLWLWLRQFTAHVSVLPADGLLRTTVARARGLDVLWTHDASMRVPNVPVMAPPDLRHFRHRVSGRRADEHHARSPRIWALGPRSMPSPLPPPQETRLFFPRPEPV